MERKRSQELVNIFPWHVSPFSCLSTNIRAPSRLHFRNKCEVLSNSYFLVFAYLFQVNLIIICYDQIVFILVLWEKHYFLAAILCIYPPYKEYYCLASVLYCVYCFQSNACIFIVFPISTVQSVK